MSNYPRIKLPEILTIIDRHAPNLRPLCVPKHYHVPKGFPSPEQFMLSAYTGADVRQRGQAPEQDLTTTNVFVTADILIRYQVPTWFVSADLCDALLHTEAPEDMRFADLQFPMPGMQFILPEAFALRYFGCPVPYIVVARTDPRHQTHSRIRLNGLPVGDIHIHNSEPLFLATMLAWEDGYPMHYDSRTPIDDKTQVKDLIAIDIKLYSYMGIGTNDHAQDNLTCVRMTNLAINLLLAMTAEPELITPEHIIRPTKKKDGQVTRPALWQPNYLGKNFTIQRDHDATGTHASPYAHWRRGHWRNQKHGPQLTLTKRLWIKPVFVGINAEPNAQ